MPEPENMVLHLLREMREDMRKLGAKVDGLATKHELKETAADLRSELRSLRADVASDLVTLEKRTSEQIVGLEAGR